MKPGGIVLILVGVALIGWVTVGGYGMRLAEYTWEQIAG